MEKNKCQECGTYVPMARYEKAKLCPSCRTMKRDGTNAITQVFRQLSKRNQNLPEEDWSHLNVECNDNQIWKYK